MKLAPRQSGHMLMSSSAGGFKNTSIKSSASPERNILVAYPPGLVIPCPVCFRCSAYLWHSSKLKRELAPTRSCVCVCSFENNTLSFMVPESTGPSDFEGLLNFEPLCFLSSRNFRYFTSA